MPTRPPTFRATTRPAPAPEARPNAHRRGYGRRWQKLRLLVLGEEPLCRRCSAEGRVTPAGHVDHILPKNQGGTDDRENLQSLCAHHHNKHKQIEDRKRGN